MNRSLDILKNIYKPYRWTIKGKTTILETTSGDFIIKEKKKNLSELFGYLQSRSFYNFPKLVDGSRKEVNVFEFLEEIKMPKEQKMEDIIDLMCDLHNKTSYYKEVSEDKFKNIYENILNNIDYKIDLYDKMYNQYFSEIYMSPSHYIFMRNYSKIISSLLFCKDELNGWYELVKEEEKIRVSVVHNNLKVDHYLKNNINYLLSWDNYLIDTPIIDFVNLYHNEYYNYNFDTLLKKYIDGFQLLEYEKKLLFILITLPLDFDCCDNEFDNTKKLNQKINYIYKTEKLLRPYYSNNEKEKQSNL